MGLNSTGTAYNFGQLGSVHMHNDHGEDLTPPVGMVIVAITCLDDTKFDKLTADTSNSVVYGTTETKNMYFGITNGNTGGNGEVVQNDIVFPAGMTIYGRWTLVSLQAAQATGGIIAYFGY
jgi:hypothetical protein|tara:strand:- start:1105 stop:1467 length:363 start_codon:yes stop_codon:yes gene_type:complete